MTLTAQVVFLLSGDPQLYLNVFYILIAGPDSLLRVISKIAADLYELLLLLLLLPRELVYLLNGLRCLLLEIFTNKGIGTAILGENKEKFNHEDE